MKRKRDRLSAVKPMQLRPTNTALSLSLLCATTALAWTLTLSSCFVGYDSRRGQAKAAQQRLAAQSTPGAIKAAREDSHSPPAARTAYDPKMASYGEDAVVLMRLALTEGDRDAVVRSQRDYVRNAKTTSWVPGAREEELAWLDAQAAASAARIASDAEAPSGEPAVDVPAELRGDDRPRFTRAEQMLRSGAVAAAYDTAKPLFAAYPSSRAVQDLRCQLATVRWLDKASLAAECAGSVALLDAGTGATR
jgi:hypothetical protein